MKLLHMMNSANGSAPSPDTVLVVEDNSDDIVLLRLAAREACPDIAFRFATDGFKALAYLQGQGEFADRQAHPFPNVVLLDVRLPGMDGFQVLERIRRLRCCNGLKVLAWSDGPDPRIAERAKQAGVQYFVPKPFSFAQLIEEVRQICQLARKSTA